MAFVGDQNIYISRTVHVLLDVASLYEFEEDVDGVQTHGWIGFQFVCQFEQTHLPGVYFDFYVTFILGPQKDTDRPFYHFLDMRGLVHFRQKLEIEVVTFEFLGQVSHHIPIADFQLLAQQVETHKYLVQGFEFLDTEISIIEFRFPGEFGKNLLLYRLIYFLDEPFLIFSATFLEEIGESLGFVEIPQYFDVFYFDVVDEHVVVVFDEIVDILDGFRISKLTLSNRFLQVINDQIYNV